MDHQKTIYLIRAEHGGNSALTKKDINTFNVFETEEEAYNACAYFEKIAKNVKFKVVEYVQRN